MSSVVEFEDNSMLATAPPLGDETVIEAEADLPSMEAVIVEVPGLTAVATPAGLTVTTDAFDDDQTVARPVNVLPLESMAFALSDTLPFTARVVLDGVTLTLATGIAVTVA